MKASRVVLVLLAGVAVARPTYAQNPQPPVEAVFRADSQIALTAFHVVAKKRYVTGLTAADFELRVDSLPQIITTFEGNQANVPIQIVLLFDTSGSVMGNGLLDEKLFRDDLLIALPEVTLSVYAFGGHADKLTRFSSPTHDPATLRQAFQSVMKKGPGEAVFDLAKPGRDSLIYESIVEILKDSERYAEFGPRMLLVVSDGRPGGDKDPTASAQFAVDSGVPVYPLMVGHQARIAEFEMENEAPRRPNEDDQSANVHTSYRKKVFDEAEGEAAAFASLGDSTGGRSFDPPDLNAATARAVIHELADEVRAEYVVGFTPEPGAPPSKHAIEVRIKGHPELKLVGGARVAVY